ncbi:MAG: RecX family transcriptional regulator [Sphingomonas bacterium]|nr:RecX family transcriptional regulator [Sphingomonas bacterium]
MTPRSTPRPLDQGQLRQLALAYVGRFATTRAKLIIYLRRKLRERGWEGTEEPALAALAEQLAQLNYVDDAAYAVAKARSLGQRGYGARRVDMALRQAGVGDDDGQAARAASAEAAVTCAVRFAQRKRIGPFGTGERDIKQRQRDLSAMIRAGHDFALSKRLLELSPGDTECLEKRINSWLN